MPYYNCIQCKKVVYNWKPEYHCHDGSYCACRGEPINLCVCSNECLEKYLEGDISDEPELFYHGKFI